MDKEYYIYHIPGKKIGCTTDLYERVTNQQGYETGEYEILYKTPNIDHASKMERILQKDYGYRVDLKSYEELSDNKFNLAEVLVPHSSSAAQINASPKLHLFKDRVGS